jgi:UPF0755 protein
MGPRVSELLPAQPAAEQRPLKPKRRSGCIAALVAVAVLVGGVGFVGSRVFDFVADRLSAAPADYPGPGQGQVTVTIEEGASGAQIGETLEGADVIADASLFADLAAADPQGASIQPGEYEMVRQMSSADALQLLISGGNRVSYAVTIPEGLTVGGVLSVVAREADIPRRALERAAERPQTLGLPAYAGGNLEGYLFPAQYEMPPGTSATEALTMMVDRFRAVAAEADIEQRARDLGLDPNELVTIASLVQAEAPAGSFGKVARVIYNREQEQMALQFDSTVHYAIGDTGGDAFTTPEERETDSPYNTYLYPGLPPGAIGAPGEEALEAALTPAEGDWLYFVTVNLETGETRFAETLGQHNANVDLLEEYCRTAEC